MYCQNCGTKNLDNARFCANCGFPIGKEAQLYAGFWKRVLALLIDAIILFVICMVLTLGIVPVLKSESDSSKTILGIVITVLWPTVYWLYCTLFEYSSKQATPGKMALGIFVTDLDGNRISFGRANGRYWARLISSLTLGIGYMMAGFTQRKQALHDIIAKCLVVRRTQ